MNLLPSTISLQIVLRPSLRLCGKRLHTNIQTAKDDVKAFQDGLLGKMEAFKTSHKYGICWITDAKEGALDYCFATSIPQNQTLPEQFEETILPAGLYAEYSVSTTEELHHLYSYLYNKLISSDDEKEDIPHYEMYLSDGPIKLYVPIVSA